MKIILRTLFRAVNTGTAPGAPSVRRFNCGTVTRRLLSAAAFAGLALTGAAPARAVDIYLNWASSYAGSNAVVQVQFSNAPSANVISFAFYVAQNPALPLPVASAGADQPNLTTFVDDFGNGVYRVTGLIFAGPNIGNGHIANLTFTLPNSLPAFGYPFAFFGSPPVGAPAGPNPEVRAAVTSALLPGSVSGGGVLVGIITWVGGTTTTWRINDATGLAGGHPGWERTVIGGSVQLAATAENPLTIQAVSLQTNGVPGPAAHFNKDTAFTWPMLTTGAGLIGFEPGRLLLDASSFQGDLGGGVLGLQATGSTVNVTFTPNRGPLASAVEYTRLRGASLRIRLSHLATNWSDLDGDGVALNSIALTSATGGRVTTNGTFIFYEPASDGPDTIAYTIRDLRAYRAGDTIRTANGMIHLAAATDAPGQSLNIVWAGLVEGNPAIRFAGIPGYTYEVQRSTNLSVSSWTTISTNTIPPGGLFEFIDSNAPPAEMRFYRTQLH